jgi:hypothetical protein
LPFGPAAISRNIGKQGCGLMLSLMASWGCAIAALLAALSTILRFRRDLRRQEQRLAECRAASEQLCLRVTELENRIAALDLQATAAPALRQRHSQHLLDRLESLADDDQLQDPAARAATLKPCFSDPFEAESPRLAIARLADQGNSAAEIARRLNRPLGEVELLLSLR